MVKATYLGVGIRVNAIAPGFFIGDQNRRVLINPDGSLTDRSKKVLAKTPMNRCGDINELIRRHFPEAKRIGSNLPGITVATFNPDSLSDPRELNDTDLAIVEGCFGVAENGAVWITQQVKFKALYFIPTALVIIINKDALVNNMHEACRQLEGTDYKYGFFVSGPSKTADIEQALVLGAHGPMKVLVVLKEG